MSVHLLFKDAGRRGKKEEAEEKNKNRQGKEKF
jgi:hypothetical protein